MSFTGLLETIICKFVLALSDNQIRRDNHTDSNHKNGRPLLHHFYCKGNIKLYIYHNAAMEVYWIFIIYRQVRGKVLPATVFAKLEEIFRL